MAPSSPDMPGCSMEQEAVSSVLPGLQLRTGFWRAGAGLGEAEEAQPTRRSEPLNSWVTSVSRPFCRRNTLLAR